MATTPKAEAVSAVLASYAQIASALYAPADSHKQLGQVSECPSQISRLLPFGFRLG
jgi:hypothetical protein